MAENDVENRCMALLRLVDSRVKLARDNVGMSQTTINTQRGSTLVEEVKVFRAQVGDLSDLLLVRNTLRGVLGMGVGFITRLSTGEEVYVHSPTGGQIEGEEISK